MENSQKSPQSESSFDGRSKLELTDVNPDEEFKNEVCLPYFNDIYKDLESRSDQPGKGINKVQFLNYALLPGMLGERFFHVMDSDQDGYLSNQEFMEGFLRLYCSNFDDKILLIFEIYDFDHDGFITKDDIATILNSLPIINNGPGQ